MLRRAAGAMEPWRWRPRVGGLDVEAWRGGGVEAWRSGRMAGPLGLLGVKEREEDYGVPLAFLGDEDGVTKRLIQSYMEILEVCAIDASEFHYHDEVVVGKFGETNLHAYFIPCNTLHCYFFFNNLPKSIFTVAYDDWPIEDQAWFGGRFEYPNVKVDGLPLDVELWQPYH